MHTRIILRYFSISRSERTNDLDVFLVPFPFDLCTCYLFCVLDFDVKRLLTTVIPCNVTPFCPHIITLFLHCTQPSLLPYSLYPHAPTVLSSARFISFLHRIFDICLIIFLSEPHPHLACLAQLHHACPFQPSACQLELLTLFSFFFPASNDGNLKTLVAKFFHHKIHANTNLSFPSFTLLGSINNTISVGRLLGLYRQHHASRMAHGTYILSTQVHKSTSIAAFIAQPTTIDIFFSFGIFLGGAENSWLGFEFIAAAFLDGSRGIIYYTVQ